MKEKRFQQENETAFIKWFSELNKNSGPIAGGKGANLAEIYNLGILVPPGFVVTAQAYDYFIKNSGLAEKIKKLLSKIDYENTEQLNNITTEIRQLIINGKMPEEMKSEILEAYEILSIGAEPEKIRKKNVNEIINGGECIFVAVRSSATTEDLAEASFAGQQETFLNVRGNEDLIQKIKECFASLFTPRATYYRNKKGFKHEQASLSVIVQKMINAEKSGVIFSKDPSMKKNNIIIEAVFGLGEGIVSGQITPDRYVLSQDLDIIEKQIAIKKIAIIRGENSEKDIIKLEEHKAKEQVLNEYEIKKLASIALQLEKHYKKPQDIEFAIEKGDIFIVQTRPITTIEKRANIDEGTEIKGEVILTGLAASPGIGSGKIKIVKNLSDLSKVKTGDVLVTKMTNPDMVVTMQRCSAIITDEGGLTAHAAIISREMGIPAVVGTQTATTKLKEGEIITVNGFTGKIYKGKIHENIVKEIRPVTAKTKTKLKVIIDLPSFAARAARSRIKTVGLARIEGIIAESQKHPLYFLKENKMKEYENIIFNGISKIAEHFQEIWVRTSDIRSDEFPNLEGAPEQKEANPMLGMHGIRFSIKNPEILKSELMAMKRVAEKGKKIGVMAPQIISVEELRKLKEFINEIGFNKAKVGIMIETPASVEIIEELCEEGINFISFGTNDLTQYTLAIDRGNSQVQDLYNEMHPAILKQIARVISVCKKKGVESSICGQAGSKKDMVKFLVEQGINSISVNADIASEIADYIEEIEAKKDDKYFLEEYKIESYEKEMDDRLKQEIKAKYNNYSQKVLNTNTISNGESEYFPRIKGVENSDDSEEQITKEEKNEIINIF
ncbi:MAG: phosphoenolpyruvate synthase [Candidatus Pacearchaeota archaeon]